MHCRQAILPTNATKPHTQRHSHAHTNTITPTNTHSGVLSPTVVAACTCALPCLGGNGTALGCLLAHCENHKYIQANTSHARTHRQANKTSMHAHTRIGILSPTAMAACTCALPRRGGDGTALGCPLAHFKNHQCCREDYVPRFERRGPVRR